MRNNKYSKINHYNNINKYLCELKTVCHIYQIKFHFENNSKQNMECIHFSKTSLTEIQ